MPAVCSALGSKVFLREAGGATHGTRRTTSEHDDRVPLRNARSLRLRTPPGEEVRSRGESVPRRSDFGDDAIRLRCRHVQSPSVRSACRSRAARSPPPCMPVRSALSWPHWRCDGIPRHQVGHASARPSRWQRGAVPPVGAASKPQPRAATIWRTGMATRRSEASGLESTIEPITSPFLPAANGGCPTGHGGITAVPEQIEVGVGPLGSRPSSRPNPLSHQP